MKKLYGRLSAIVIPGKLLSPIIYAVSVAPLYMGLLLIMLFFDSLYRNYGFYPFYMFHDPVRGVVEIIILMIIPSILFFWLINRFMVWYENIHKPNFIDHFRQTIILYVIAFYILITTGHVADKIFNIIVFTCPIVINALYLYKRNYDKPTTRN